MQGGLRLGAGVCGLCLGCCLLVLERGMVGVVLGYVVGCFRRQLECSFGCEA